MYAQMERVYNNGGRYFVLFNIAPLYLAPLYALPPYGVGNDQYWHGKPKNHTLINGRMLEEVETVNAIYQYRTPYAVELKKRYPGASFAVYDVNGLVSSDAAFQVLRQLTMRTDDRYLQQSFPIPEWHASVQRNWLCQPLQHHWRGLC